jgi:hypothetical protein
MEIKTYRQTVELSEGHLECKVWKMKRKKEKKEEKGEGRNKNFVLAGRLRCPEELMLPGIT